ncbi:MAG: hypothetical protein LKJ45_07265 [Oscillospiraceae bacterium]|jgi:hypothetical protein|nr:hypothetical protein [Oscillospiraceae bacterium]
MMFGKKKKNLFGSSIEPNCEYCANYSGTFCHLGRKGPSCSHFRYDPLKRSPFCPPELKKHDPDEFKL